MALASMSFWSCGAGTAGIVAGTSSGGGGGNSPSSVSDVSLSETKKSPALIRFQLIDADSDPVSVEVLYRDANGITNPATLVAGMGIDVNLDGLESAPNGFEHKKRWDFMADFGDQDRHPGISIVVQVLVTMAEGESPIGEVGNDAPVVSNVSVPTNEVTGIALVELTVSDSSLDLVDVLVEFDIQEDSPDAGWKPATPASGPGIQNIQTDPGGTLVSFFWDVVRDLGTTDLLVRMRFTPRDKTEPGVSLISNVFAVDNNAQPFVTLGGGLFTNPDTLRGIPLPYKVIDEEGDLVRVLFQWRLPTDPDFEDLGTTDPDELAMWIEDPAYVREKQICTPFPSFARGHAFPVDATHLRLPELVQDESYILANESFILTKSDVQPDGEPTNGVEGRDLELLRPHAEPEALAATWNSNPLNGPVAAIPLGAGLAALVLDDTGSGSSLLEVVLATGEVERTVASGLMGIPTALAFEAERESVLVATDLGDAWQLFGVDLASGAVSTLFPTGAGSPTAPLRAIAPLGSDAALATAGDALWRLDWSDPANARTSLVVGGLATPWGLVLDPLREGRVYVAERDWPVTGGTGRVVSVDLDTLAIKAVVASAPPSGGPAFPNPTSIALDRGQNRLIALCETTGSPGRELRGLNLGRAENTVFSLGVVDAEAEFVAAGPTNLLLVALPRSADLAAGGGVEQVRPLASFDRATAIATVEGNFDPSVRNLQPWRISARDSFRSPTRASLAGTQGVFLWDNRDVGIGTSVLLKATCMDQELGVSVSTTVSRAVSGVAFTAQQPIPTGDTPVSVVAADLDGDGNLDLVSANRNSDDLTVFYQDAPRTFIRQPPIPTGGLRPRSLVAADLDGDGDLDLVSANNFSDDLTVFFGRR